MKTTIKQLHLRNFKKAQNLSIDFDSRITNIEGDNGTGKTTVFDAFNWCLFGKNSENKSDFSIKTLDAENNAIPKLEHEVVAVFDVDGVEYTFKRVYKEKYTKKRGSSVESFDGHKEELFVNDVPKSLSEYNSVIDSIFKTSISRMITDPTYFNEVLKWEQRRTILMEMAGEISEQSILDNHPELELIPTIFAEGKTIEDKKKELAAKREKVKEGIDSVPSRLDEIDRQTDKELRPIDVLLSTRDHVQKQIETINAEITDASKGMEEINSKRAKLINERGNQERIIFEEKTRIQRDHDIFVRDLNSKQDQIKYDIDQKQKLIALKRDAISGNMQRVEVFRASNDDLKAQFLKISGQTFNVHDATCPSCKQPLPHDEIEQKRLQFNQFSSSEQDRLKGQAVENNEKIAKLKNDNEQLHVEIEQLEKEISELKSNQQDVTIPTINFESPDIDAANARISELNAEIEALPTDQTQIDVTEQKNKLSELNLQLDAIKRELFKHDNNETLTMRRNELIEQQQKQIAELGEIERFEHQIAQFTKLHIEQIEKRVNNMFVGVEFKMFEQQINGGEKPTCICLVNGVPYPDVNTAGQINAGLRIIEALQDHFGMMQPIFIDNRERVSQIVPMKNQIINLTKVTGVEQLTVK